QPGLCLLHRYAPDHEAGVRSEAFATLPVVLGVATLVQPHDAVRAARFEQGEHLIAAEGPVAHGEIALLEVPPELVEALDVALPVGAGDEVGKGSPRQI